MADPLHPLPELLSAERETEVPFLAYLGDQPMQVTAVLERTVVAHPINDASDRRVIRLGALRARRRDVAHGSLKTGGPWRLRPKPDKQ